MNFENPRSKWAQVIEYTNHFNIINNHLIGTHAFGKGINLTWKWWQTIDVHLKQFFFFGHKLKCSITYIFHFFVAKFWWNLINIYLIEYSAKYVEFTLEIKKVLEFPQFFFGLKNKFHPIVFETMWVYFLLLEFSR
jgi:hypothetical protein